mgnify:CR=1 FL=1
MEALYKTTVQADCYDHRDHLFCDLHGENSSSYSHISCPVQLKTKIAEHIHEKVDLRHLLNSPIINQGLLNSCSACALSVAAELYFVNENSSLLNTNAIHKDQLKQTAKSLNASPMFIYYHERVLANEVDFNKPVFIRDGIKVLNKHGVCSEPLWPYPEMAYPSSIASVVKTGTFQDVQLEVAKVLKENATEIHAAITEKPSTKAIEQANQYKIIRYCKLSVKDDLTELKLSLSKGIPFIFGMMVPKSFFLITNNGVMTMPTKDEIRLGGHAMLAVGFDDEKEVFIVRNSYGDTFGDKGYCYIPYQFFLSSYNTTEGEVNNTFSYWCLSSL